MDNSSGIVVLDSQAPGEAADPAAGNILAGQPRGWVANQYTDASGQFFCGIWQGSGGRWRVRYTEHEFCVILEGQVRIEAQEGAHHNFQVGDAFVIPAGFIGSWEVIGHCRKWYAIFEART